MEAVIYMPLVEDGTDRWRPVRATHIAEDIFEVIEQIPSDESWKLLLFLASTVEIAYLPMAKQVWKRLNTPLRAI